MNTRSKLVLASVLSSLLLMASCSSSPVMFDSVVTVSPYIENGMTVHRVFFDREGYIYPLNEKDNPVSIDREAFSEGAGKAYLKRYFCMHKDQLESLAVQAGAKKQVSKEQVCELYSEVDEGEKRAIRYSMSPEQDQWLDRWEQIQESLLSKQAQALTDWLQGYPSDTPLFISIHGFNNNLKSIKGSYCLIRSYLKKNYPDKKFAFLDVYWDGFSATFPPSVWSKAQYTGPLIGVKLRKLLNGIDPQRPVRILSHSSGAFVLGNLIGNGRKAIPLGQAEHICVKARASFDQAYCHYQEHVLSDSDYPILASMDVRVGMIAPATSSWIFTGAVEFGIDGEPKEGLFKPAGQLTLVVGQHIDDYANTKLFFSPENFGYTTLGVNKSSFCEIKKHVLNSSELVGNVDLWRVDFSPAEGEDEKEKWFIWADHGLDAYFRRPKSRLFFDRFLDMSSTKPADITDSACGAD